MKGWPTCCVKERKKIRTRSLNYFLPRALSFHSLSLRVFAHTHLHYHPPPEGQSIWEGIAPEIFLSISRSPANRDWTRDSGGVIAWKRRWNEKREREGKNVRCRKKRKKDLPMNNVSFEVEAKELNQFRGRGNHMRDGREKRRRRDIPCGSCL